MMARHWTGGQYSLFRVLLAVCAFIHIAIALSETGTAPSTELRVWMVAPALLACVVVASLLAVGAIDRAAALLLAAVHTWLHGETFLTLTLGELVLTFLLLIHALMPTAPYGSWSAMGRAAPDGAWQMPETISLTVWIALIMTTAVALLITLPAGGWLFAGVAVPLLWLGRHHLAIWVAALALLAGVGLFGDLPGPATPLFLLFLLAFDPAWIPARDHPATAILFFDDTCALCHGAVRFLLAEDREQRFRFSPIGGEQFTRTLSEETISSLPDSMLLVTDAGELLMKSDAVIACLQRLGGLWRALGLIFSFVPKPFRDRGYDLVGRRRYALFGRKTETCPLMTEEQRRRFIA